MSSVLLRLIYNRSLSKVTTIKFYIKIIILISVYYKSIKKLIKLKKNIDFLVSYQLLNLKNILIFSWFLHYFDTQII